MILNTRKLKHINTISHDGKVLVFGASDDGQIFYTVRRSGFEDTALQVESTDPTGFEDWQALSLDKSVPDPSVDEYEQ
jgi:hypothetical protein